VRRIFDPLLACGTLLSLACLFLVGVRTDQQRTLISALELPSKSEPALSALLTLLCDLVIVLTVCLPPLLWVELTVAARPLSRRVRALLIGQGLVGLVGVALTAFCMLLTMLCCFGFSVSSSPAPVSGGFYAILVFEVVFALASVFLGVARSAPDPGQGRVRDPG
jgi:hypothetical protein